MGFDIRGADGSLDPSPPQVRPALIPKVMHGNVHLEGMAERFEVV
jgi:hypothetical protein